MSSDLDNLKDMGFDPERSELALKKSGNLTSAIDWLDKNADKTIEDLRAETANTTTTTSSDDNPALEAGEVPRSMVCNECGKKFRGMSQAQFHAEKSGHDDFAESTEELAPLTEEQKKQKLEEMRAALAEKRKGQQAEDKVANKRNEDIRRKATKDASDAKEELQRKERVKEAQKKKKEKEDDIAAKKRIREKIEQDKEARRKKAEEEKAIREGKAGMDPQGGAGGGAAAASAPKPAQANHTQARLRLQVPDQNLTKSFPAETTLFEVAHVCSQEAGVEVESFTTTFPKKTFDQSDFGLTLKEAGLVPSAVLIVK
ncbi:hypothetical protein MBLNU230_g1464t1 [Neophaeotheca triangularis]